MAFTTGTATDYKDLLQKLRDYLTGADSSPVVSRGWTVLRDTSTNSPQPSPLEYEMVFRGNGDASPEKEIFFQIKTFSDSVAGYFNWEIRGMTGYTEGSPVGSHPFDSQPGISPKTYVPLQNASMSYWFYVTGRRVCIVVKTGTSYQFMYVGFLDIFAFDNEWPYPLMVMGSSHSSTRVFSSNSVEYSSSINPGGSSDTSENTDNSVAYLRSVNGSWYPVKNISQSSGSEATTTKYGYHVHPMRPYTTTGFDTVDFFQTNLSLGSLVRTSTPGGTPTANIFPADDPAGNKRQLINLEVYSQSPSKEIVGEIHNVFWVSAAGGLTAEDVITDTNISPNVTYTAFQNIHRTDNWCFFAIKDE